MPETGDVSGLRDRLTKLEFETSQRPTKDFVQDAADKMLSKAAANDKERNDQLLKLFDERLGAHRSAIITELERDLNSFKNDALSMIEKVLQDKLPGAVKKEVDKLEAEKAAKAEKARIERDKKVQRYKNRFMLAGSIMTLLTSLVIFYYAFEGEAQPKEVRAIDKANDALSFVQ